MEWKLAGVRSFCDNSWISAITVLKQISKKRLTVSYWSRLSKSPISSGFFFTRSVFGGYYSGRMYKSLKGQLWKRAALQTGILYPGICATVAFFLNFFVWGKHSSGAVSDLPHSFSLFIWLSLFHQTKRIGCFDFGLKLGIVVCGSGFCSSWSTTRYNEQRFLPRRKSIVSLCFREGRAHRPFALHRYSLLALNLRSWKNIQNYALDKFNNDFYIFRARL